MEMSKWHSKEIKEVLRELDSDENGLSGEEVKKRLERFGLNELKEKGGINPLKIFLDQFKNILIIVLILAAVISLGIGEIIDGGLILIIVVLNGIFGFIQDYKAEKSVEELKKLSSPRVRVVRDNTEEEIDSKFLVPGDIILLEEGDAIPADCRIIDEKNLKVDESALTGESVAVTKEEGTLDEKTPLAERKNSLFKGTNVIRGRCKAVVVETGMGTVLGKIARDIEEIEKEKTPFQQRLDKLGKQIGAGILGICIFIAVVLFMTKAASPIHVMLISIALAVAAIPEGLPAVITLSLALGVKRMVKKNSLVRRLPVAEGLGSVDVICSDKTGTITENEMTVREIFTNNKLVEVTGEGYSVEGEFLERDKLTEKDRESIKFLLKSGMLCNNANIGVDEEGNTKFLGDPTEISLLISGLKYGFELTEVRREYQRIDEIPFSSERKCMTTIHEKDGKTISFTKGAPEIIIKLCNRIYLDGKVKGLKESEKEELLKTNEDLAERALRVLGFAYKPEPRNGEEEKDLIFLGFQGMIDPPRKGVKRAVQDCKNAGIRVVMITGDNKITARVIAEDVGIIGDILDGGELDELSDDELREIVEKVEIFARVSPSHKVRILRALKENGHIVAMTGDGVNDAPALKAADVGVGMGIKGTDVAKQTSDLILLDDNFATIRDAVEEGRIIFDNVKKFVNYLLSCNLAEVLILFLASLPLFTSKPLLPLTAVQLLWINLLTDGMPALALGVDPAVKGIMKRKPRKKNEGVIDKRMIYSIIYTGIVMTFIILFIFYSENPDIKEKLRLAQTMTFTSLVVFELVRIHIIRKPQGLGFFSNKWLILAILSSIGLQLVVLYSPLSVYFRVVPLSIDHWAKIIAGLFSFYVFAEIFNKFY
ncbi:MAG TPA: cation-translocating P-type ATPase [Candidatus Altiarchaeales archaeon]|nr:cation-translocating P-type ATPase [Candidatus Altiarchaeales archaeon]